MAVELVYTSAPKTLDGPGYGVVSKTENLPARLENAMRQLNRYDFAMAAEGDSPVASPVVYSHTTFSDASCLWHIMSRVGRGGMDYSNRDVFIAHHVAVTGDELGQAAVTGLMQDPSMFQSRWDGRVGLLPRRSVPISPPETRGSGAWSSLAGHADWAKVWLDRWSQQEDRPNFVIVPAEADVVGLFAEALALLPAGDAKRVAFITQMPVDRDGVRFNWIGLTAGSALASSTLARSPDRTLDLSRPMRDVPKTNLIGRRAASTGSRRDAATEVRPSVTPDPNGGYLDEFWREDKPRSVPRSRSDRPESSPALVPPPPPPPEKFRARYAVPLVCAGLALTAIVVGGAWRLGAFGTGQRKVVASGAEAEPKVVATETPRDQETPASPPPKVAQAPGKDPGEGGDRGLPKDQRKEFIKTTDEVSKTRVVALNNWLSNTLSEASPGTWVKVLEIDEKDLPPLPTLKYIPCNGSSGLNSVPLPAESGDNGIEVRLTAGGGDVSFSIRLQKDRGIEVRRPSTLNDDLLDRMPYGVLEISSMEIGSGLEAAIGRKRVVRVILTPLLPEVPLFSEEWKIKGPLESGATAFFKKTHALQENLQARIRIDRVTLSFLPRENIGWRISLPGEKPAESLLGKALTSRVELEMPDGAWPLTLNVRTHFDRSDLTLSPIDAQLVEPSSAPKPVSGENGDGIQVPAGEPGRVEPEDKGAKGRADQRGDRPIGGKPRRETSSDRPKSGGATAGKEIGPEQWLRQIDNHALMFELLRRYGRVHGSVVIRVQGGKTDEDVEVLRFGKTPQVTHP